MLDILQFCNDSIIEILFSTVHTHTCACMHISRNFNYFRNLKFFPFFISGSTRKFFIKSRVALKGFCVSSFFLPLSFFACPTKLGCDSDDRVSCFFANKCRRVRLAKRRHRCGRPCTCCLEYPSVQVGFSWASPLATTVPTISVSRKMGDEITFLFSKFLLYMCRSRCHIYFLPCHPFLELLASSLI